MRNRHAIQHWPHPKHIESTGQYAHGVPVEAFYCEACAQNTLSIGHLVDARPQRSGAPLAPTLIPKRSEHGARRIAPTRGQPNPRFQDDPARCQGFHSRAPTLSILADHLLVHVRSSLTRLKGVNFIHVVNARGDQVLGCQSGRR